MRVEVHDRFDGELAREWDELADRAGAAPWMRPGWFQAWWRSFGKGQIELLALRDERGLVGVLPLGRRHGVLRSPTNWHSPEFGVVAADGAARDRLATAALARRPRRLSVAFLSGDSCGRGELAVAAVAAGYRVLERVIERSPYVELGARWGSWDEYQSSRDRKFVKDLLRRRRRLGEQGPVELELLTPAENELGALLEDGFRLESSGHKLEGGTAILSRLETRSFYTQIARWAAQKGSLRLAFLRVGERRIAFELLVADGGRVYNLKGGYDVDFRVFAPGKVIAYEILKHFFARDYETYEFLGHAEPWKLEWTDTLRDRVLLQAFAATLGGRTDLAAHRWGRPVAKRALALARR